MESQKKRSKKTAKVQRAVVGATLEAIKAKREMNPAARLAERKKAVEAVKEQKKAKAAKKAAEKTSEKKSTKSQQPKISKQSTKGFAPKAAATSR